MGSWHFPRSRSKRGNFRRLSRASFSREADRVQAFSLCRSRSSGSLMAPGALAGSRVPGQARTATRSPTRSIARDRTISMSPTSRADTRDFLVKGRDPAWSRMGRWLTYRTGNPDRPGRQPDADPLDPGRWVAARGCSSCISPARVRERRGPCAGRPTATGSCSTRSEASTSCDPNGKDLRKVVGVPGPPPGVLRPRAFVEPSGTAVVFAVLCDGGNLGIWRVNVDGGGRAQVVGTGHGDPFEAAYQPVWSPDGKSIVFVGIRRTRRTTTQTPSIRWIRAEATSRVSPVVEAIPSPRRGLPTERRSPTRSTIGGSR
jgi:hypothetical protein